MATVEWIGDTEAARILDLSEKRVWQFGAAGRLKIRREVNPQTDLERTVYHAGSVEKLREERINRVKAATQALVKHGIAQGLAAPREQARHGEVYPPSAKFRPHEWLTFAEAARYTRLPARHLIEAVKSGELKRRDIGMVKGHRFRVKVAELDALAGMRQEKAKTA